MEIKDSRRNIEIGIWHNGKPVVPQYQHGVDLKGGGYWNFRIPSHHTSALGYDVRIEFEPGAAIVDGYIPGRMWLLDYSGSVIGTPRPTLIHTEPSDLPMSTMFLCSWVDLPNQPSLAGVWIVTTCVVANNYRVPAKEAPTEEAP